MKQVPTHAQVVIIGGGIVGCSVAYHLTKLGWQDVILLERKELTSGTTWAAAGLVGQLQPRKELTKLACYGHDLYERLEKETGQDSGYSRCGSMRVARTKERKSEYDRLMAMAHAFGIEMEEIPFAKARDLWPLLNTDGLEAVYYQPNDGMTSPVDTALALAKGARMGGAQIFENIKVNQIHLDNGAVSGVGTDQGKIACEYVVNCGGMWGRDIGAMVGVSLPLHAAEHMHITTKPIEGVYKGMPILRDMDGRIYFREEVGGLMMGGFEPVAKPYGADGIPDDFKFTELGEDWEQFGIFIEAGIQRCPALESAEIIHLNTVPESFTVDNGFILGEAPGVKNFFVAAGMNSAGIANAGGAGMALARWMDQGYPEEDLWPVDIRRFYGWQRNKLYLKDMVTEALGNVFADHWPFKQPKTARPALCSPFHDRLKDMGACFGVVAGWERPNWFASEGVTAEYEYSWGRQNWFDYSATEHKAVRENVGVYDLSSMGKFMLQGRDAEKVLQNICANDMGVENGKVVYTQFLNARGGIEADLTVTRLEQDKFYIVTSAANRMRDFEWIQQHIPKDAHAVLTDVTYSNAVLAVMGPKSRDLLEQLTDADLSNAAFPFATAQQIDIGYARPLAIRISFAGELGWELHIPSPFATGVFDTIWEAGKKYDAQLVGLHAVDSLRLEKGYPHWGSDIGPDYSPLEAGLSFAVKLNKAEFIGRDALLKQKEAGITRRLVTFIVKDPEPLLYHDEPIYSDGHLVSENTHGAYAHTLGCAMGMCYLSNPDGISDEWLSSGNYEINIEGKMYPIEIHGEPPYDPKNLKIKA